MKKKIDTSYVKRLQKGDISAFNEIYKWYKDKLYYFALASTRNFSDSEEIVQMTFIDVVNKIHTLKKIDSFHSWIFSIASNNIKLFYRIEKTDRYLDLGGRSLDEFAPPVISQTQDYELNEVSNIILDELSKMPKKFEQVGFLRYMEDMSVGDIAAVLGVPEGTVKSRLSKVRDILKFSLEESGYHPQKYFSVAGVPILTFLFTEVMKQNQLSIIASNRIYDVVLTSTDVPVSALKGSVLTKYATKILVGSAVAITSGFALYSNLGNTEQEINDISYTKELTNKNVEVSVSLNKEVDQDNNKIKIYMNEKSIPFDTSGKTIVFTAKDNGSYVIKIDKETSQIDISNIDKIAPRLQKISNYEDTIVFDIADGDDINYQKSFAMIDGNKMSLNKNNTVQLSNADWNSGQLELYDKANNYASYRLEKGSFK